MPRRRTTSARASATTLLPLLALLLGTILTGLVADPAHAADEPSTKTPLAVTIDTLTPSTLKADPTKRMIPVVVMTSSREEQDLVRSYAAGVNAYVVKPLDFLELVSAVRALGAFWMMLNEPPPGRRLD